MAEHDKKSDRELLVEVVTDMKWVKCTIEKHLSHHDKLFFAALAVLGSGVVGLLLLILPKVF